MSENNPFEPGSESLLPTARKRRSTKASAAETTKKFRRRVPNVEKKIERQLTSIYEDSTGRLPNMKEIKLKKEFSLFKFLFTILALGALIAGAAWIGLFILPTDKNFADTTVKLVVTGPEKITLGDTTTYIIRYANDDSAALTGATLAIRYPDGFQFVSSTQPFVNEGKNEIALGKIAPHASGAVALTGRMYGTVGAEQSWRIVLNYQPENLASVLQKHATLTILPKKSPIALKISGPAEAVTGQQIEYSLTINQTDPTLQWPPLTLSPTIPPSFTVNSSTPPLDKNQRWTITFATATTSNQLTYKLKGQFSSVEDQQAKIKAILTTQAGKEGAPTYPVAESSLVTALAQENVSLSLIINGTNGDSETRPGELLNIALRLQNNSKDQIQNAVIRLSIDSPSINKQSALYWPGIQDTHNGDITGEQLSEQLRHGQITWDSKKIPDLALLKPGKEVLIDLSLPVRDHAQFEWSSVSGSTITLLGAISYIAPGNTKKQSTIAPTKLTINSDLALEIKTEETTGPNNTKIFPTIWVLTNHVHGLKNISVTADVFGKVVWQTNDSPAAGTLNYDEKNQRITWNIPEMPESVDVLAAPFIITLTSKNPTQSTLVGKPRVTAEDQVTGKKIDFTGAEIPLKTE